MVEPGNDPLGRLLSFTAVPPQVRSIQWRAAAAGMDHALRGCGLDPPASLDRAEMDAAGICDARQPGRERMPSSRKSRYALKPPPTEASSLFQIIEP